MLTSLDMRSAEHLRFIVAGGLLLSSACGGESVLKISAVRDKPGAEAGDGGNAADIDPKSGSRLTVLPYSPSFPPVRDLERNVNCTPRLAADGVERCLPYFPHPVHFSDPSCTHAVIVRGQGPPTYCQGGDEYFTDDGGARRCFAPGMTVYTAGASIDPPPQLYGHGTEFCAPVGVKPAMGSVLEFYEAVPSDPTKWVELVEDVIPVTDLLAVVNWRGTDGSILRNGFRLLPSGIACDQYPDPNLSPELLPESWCVPSMRARVQAIYPEYADSQCSGERLAASCDIAEVIQGEPSPIPPLYEAGSPVSPVYFQNAFDGGKCTLLPPHDPSNPDASIFYTQGPRLEPGRYPSLTLGRIGTGRIQTEYLQNAGKNLAAGAFYDTRYDQRCTPMPLSDGKTWCVPGALWVDSSNLNAFADSTCTHRIVISAAQSDDPLAPFRFGLLFPDDRACKPTEYPTLHSIQEYGGSAFEQVEGECLPFSPQGPMPLMFELGDELDPSTVVEKMP